MGEKLAHSESHVGSVGGHTVIVRASGTTVGVSGAAYSAGDVIGDQSPIKLAKAARVRLGTGVIHSVTVYDKSAQALELDIIFFDSRPSSTTFTDNSALTLSDLDIEKVIGTVTIGAGDYVSFAASAVGTKTAINLPFQSRNVEGDIYIAVLTQGAPTYAADELSIAVGIFQD